ncbi:MAG: FkbM family methyltransferase [Hyphomicrobiaceae bacterium]|nr:FkbM family methyltransferase [Hyphomicrobiaceae bacterium]
MTVVDDVTPFGTYRPAGLVAALVRFTRGCGTDWLGKRMAFTARRAALALLRKPVDIDVFGASMRLYPFKNVCEKRTLFTPQLFDPLERAFLDETLKEGGIVVDIGANVGVYTLFAASRVGHAGRVIAVEPQPSVLKRLRFNIAINDFSNVTVLPIAIADKEGDITLFLDTLNEGEASMKHVGAGSAAGTVVSVPARPLTDMLASEALPRIDVLKLDVEGAEDLILVPFFRDAPESLLPGAIILENGSGSWQSDLVALALGKGYRIRGKGRLNLILEREGA